MIFLLLTILSSLLTSVVLKVNETRGGSRPVVAGVNYIVAATLALAMGAWSRLDIGGEWIGVGIVAGAGFIGGFLMLMRGIKEIGLAIPTSAARLSMLIPVAGSIVCFEERPSLARIIGIVAGVAAFVMLGSAQRRRDRTGGLDFGAVGVLAAIFMIVGITDFSMKAAQTSGADKDGFAFWVFASAAAFCWLVIAARRIPVVTDDVVRGVLLGMPNYFSVYFLLLALRHLDASVVFPIVSAGGVIAVTATAVIFWKEHPNRTAWIGIVLAAIAVALLGLSG